MFSTSGQRSLCVPWQQRLEVLCERCGGQVAIEERQIGERFDAVSLGGLDQRVKVRAGSCTRSSIAEQPSLAADDERTDRVLTAVVVERDLRTIEEDDELLPLTKGIVHGLAEQTLRQYFFRGIGQPRVQLCNDRDAFGLAHLHDRVSAGFAFAQLSLDPIQPSDVVERHASSALAVALRLAGFLELASRVSPTSRVYKAVLSRCGAVGFIAV